jgi:hypothetical protein
LVRFEDVGCYEHFTFLLDPSSKWVFKITGEECTWNPNIDCEEDEEFESETRQIVKLRFPRGKLSTTSIGYVNLLKFEKSSILKAKKNKLIVRKKFLAQYQFDFEV